MRLVGRGHESIRATHRKTLEFTADTDLSDRGTCIVAVDVRAAQGRAMQGRAVQGRAVQGPAIAPLAGRVRITIEVGDESFALLADANSAWDPTGPAVVRRGPLRLPGTFAVNADAAAADLPRTLVAALADPRAEVRITADLVAGPATVVLLAIDPVAPDEARLRAELDAADAVLAEDDGARRFLAAAEPALRLLTSAADLPAGRVLVVATADLPGRSVPAGARRVEVVGLPTALAAAAAMPGGAPVTLASGADVRASLRTTPAGHRLLLDTDRRRLPELLGAAQDIRGATTAVVVQDFADPVIVDISAPLPPFAGATRLWCCLPAAATGAALDPAVQAALTGLLADGVATKPAARALAALTGWPQRQAYAEVVAQTRRP